MQGMCTAEHLTLTVAAPGNTTRRLKYIQLYILYNSKCLTDVDTWLAVEADSEVLGFYNLFESQFFCLTVTVSSTHDRRQ
jgi:hypothetical protein